MTKRWDPTGTSIPDQSGPGSNGTKEELHTLQSSRTRASPTGNLLPDCREYSQHILRATDRMKFRIGTQWE